MKKGFTLIELLVVVLIIGILSAIAFPQYRVAVDKARMTEATQSLARVRDAIDVYVLANGYESVGFFGEGGYEGALDVDFESSWSCPVGYSCYSKYFYYNAYCVKNSGFCMVKASTDKVGYDITSTKYESTGKWSTICEPKSESDTYAKRLCDDFNRTQND